MIALVTGFGPFGSVDRNPSADLAMRLSQRPPPGWQIDSEVLAVSYECALRATSLLAQRPYDLALLLGVHGRDARMYLELFGRRQVGTTPDVTGVTVVPRWFPPGPDRYASTLFDVPLVQAVGDSRITWSYCAGGYLCNAWYYLALGTRGAPPCGFVHVPHSEFSSPKGDHLSLDVQEMLLRTIFEAAVRRLAYRKERNQ